MYRRGFKYVRVCVSSRQMRLRLDVEPTALHRVRYSQPTRFLLMISNSMSMCASVAFRHGM